MAGKPRYGITITSALYSLLVHAVVAVLLFATFSSSPLRVSAPPPPGSNIEPVKARMVSEAEIEAQVKKIREQEDKKRVEQEQAQKKLQQLLTEAKEAEQRKLREEQKLKEAQRKRLQEKKKADELARKRKEEQLRLAKLEKDKAAKERKAEEERKKREAAEKKKREAAARKAEEEKKKRELAERKRREAELRAELAAEQERELARRVDALLGRYIPIIRQKVSRNWNKPPNTPKGIEAKVQVRLTATGEVVSVRLVQSSGNSVFDRSVENAVHKASPLPIPQEHGVNEKFRNLHLIFKPEDLLS